MNESSELLRIILTLPKSPAYLRSALHIRQVHTQYNKLWMSACCRDVLCQEDVTCSTCILDTARYNVAALRAYSIDDVLGMYIDQYSPEDILEVML